MWFLLAQSSCKLAFVHLPFGVTCLNFVSQLIKEKQNTSHELHFFHFILNCVTVVLSCKQTCLCFTFRKHSKVRVRIQQRNSAWRLASGFCLFSRSFWILMVWTGIEWSLSPNQRKAAEWQYTTEDYIKGSKDQRTETDYFYWMCYLSFSLTVAGDFCWLKAPWWCETLFFGRSDCAACFVVVFYELCTTEIIHWPIRATYSLRERNCGIYSICNFFASFVPASNVQF